MSACKTIPAGLPLPVDQQSAMDRRWRGRLQETTRGTRPLSGTNDDSLEDFWRLSVLDYTNLDLTNQSDKRIAIWGIAKRIRDMRNEEYVAGMWEDALEEQLGWKVADCTVTERPDDLAGIPTWSWTSIKGMILMPGRSRQWQRSYRVTDHMGQKMWFDLADDYLPPVLHRQTTESAADMSRELGLADKRRGLSSVPRMQASQPETAMSTDDTSMPGDVFRATEIRSQQILSHAGTRVSRQIATRVREPQSKTIEMREKEPELQDTRLAIQGFLHVGSLKQIRPSGGWSFEIQNTSTMGTEIEAFPDMEPKTNFPKVTFVVLALTQFPDQGNVNNSIEETWYEGHGLMLQETEEEWCYRRIGVLEIRRLSCYTGQQLQTMSSSLKETKRESDLIPRKNFFLA
jgi:hypothetical protein